MHQLTVSDLVNAVGQLDKTNIYSYVSGKTKLRIVEVRRSEGPIIFWRWESQKSEADGKLGSISTAQLTRIASVCTNRPNYPLHVDRLFSAGGNSRSALETILAHTPNFFICYPKRTDAYTGKELQNLKHIMWCPTDEHPLGTIAQKDYQEVIAEIELGLDFGTIGVDSTMLGTEFDSIEAKRIHTQMQIALIKIGNALNFQTWIAKNDRHIPVGDTQLGLLEGVLQSLDEMSLLHNDEIRNAAALIDCIWFTKDGRRVPAVLEIEQSTRVTSGMTRMQKFESTFPSLSTTFTIVAPNELRRKVVTEANAKIYRHLNARFMPYSTIRELYGLIQRYQLANVVDHTFIKPFMEIVVEN